jgi:death-on-curing protein
MASILSKLGHYEDAYDNHLVSTALEGLLQSALSRPESLYFYGDPKYDIAELAAAYGFGIRKNHPFNDGNNGTALIAVRLFLKLNGFDLAATGTEKFITIVDLSARPIGDIELASWIRGRT